MRARRAARVVAATAAAAVLALGAAGCGGDDPGGMGMGDGGMGMGSGPSERSEPSGPAVEVSERHDEDDVTFAQEMIPHHAQALRMVEMVERHGASDELADLAAQMETAQEREIGLMEQMLETWGEDLPDSGLMGHGMSGMDGEALERLEDVRPDDFDSMWALMMIEHHEDAIEMSEVELDEGVNPEAHQLARDIIEAQTREIAQLEDIARS
jgi:uncharacterized protein (DUF305 family)